MNRIKILKNKLDAAFKSINGVRSEIEDAICEILHRHGVIKVDLSEFGDEDYVCARPNNHGWCSEVSLNRNKYAISKIDIVLKCGNLEGKFGLLDLGTKDMITVANKVQEALKNDQHSFLKDFHIINKNRSEVVPSHFKKLCVTLK